MIPLSDCFQLGLSRAAAQEYSLSTAKHVSACALAVGAAKRVAVDVAVRAHAVVYELNCAVVCACVLICAVPLAYVHTCGCLPFRIFTPLCVFVFGPLLVCVHRYCKFASCACVYACALVYHFI